MVKNTINNNILISGITGFLGSSLAEYLIKKNYTIIGIKRSFSSVENLINVIDNKKLKLFDIDKCNLEDIFIENKIDIVINTATSSSNRGGNISQIMDANIVLPLKLLEYSYKNNCSLFLNAGVFIPNNYVDSYYLSKKIFLDSMKEYSKHIKIIDVHLQMLYGKNSSETQFVSKIILSFLNNTKLLNLTKGDQKRDFIYISDALSAFNIIINNMCNFNEKYTKIELGNGNSISIKSLIEQIKVLTENKITKLNFGSIEYRNNEIMDYKADIALISSLKWKPKTSIEHGLIDTINGLKNKRND